ncbi:hypothetical protein Tco_1248922, partial [Tanacetum coccineum]
DEVDVVDGMVLTRMVMRWCGEGEGGVSAVGRSWGGRKSRRKRWGRRIVYREREDVSVKTEKLSGMSFHIKLLQSPSCENIDEEVYVSQPPGFLDPKSPQKVYKVVKALIFFTDFEAIWLLLSPVLSTT